MAMFMYNVAPAAHNMGYISYRGYQIVDVQSEITGFVAILE